MQADGAASLLGKNDDNKKNSPTIKGANKLSLPLLLSLSFSLSLSLFLSLSLSLSLSLPFSLSFFLSLFFSLTGDYTNRVLTGTHAQNKQKIKVSTLCRTHSGKHSLQNTF